jgi:hypothetical protein
MLDYSGIEFPYGIPRGDRRYFVDNKGKTTHVTSNYAVSYKFTNIIDLQGKVKIVSQNGRH